MSWKKNAFSYVCWFLYAVLTGTALLCITGYASEALGLSVYWGILFAVLYALCAAVLVILLHRASVEAAAFFAGKRVLEGLIKAILLAILSTVGLYLRMRVINGLGTISDSLATTMMVELILQIAVAFLLFFVLKRLSGYFSGLIPFGFVMCAPFVVKQLTLSSPEMFYVLISLAVFALIAIGYKKKLYPALFFLFGALSAFVTYMDLTGAVLFVVTVALIFVSREYGAVAGRKIAALICCVIGFGAGFCGCAFTQGLLSKVSFVAMLEKWFSRYMPDAFSVPVVAEGGNLYGEAFVLIGLMVFGIFSFWYDRNEERLSLGVILLCGLIALCCFGMVSEMHPGTLGIYLLMATLAGVGVQQCMCGVCVPVAMLEPEMPQMQEEAFEEIPQEVPKAVQVERQDEVSETVQVEKPHIQFIENPLPLPKKHEKKVMDYDLDVADDDDFDI